jgi:hypothetical protein
MVRRARARRWFAAVIMDLVESSRVNLFEPLREDDYVYAANGYTFDEAGNITPEMVEWVNSRG